MQGPSHPIRHADAAGADAQCAQARIQKASSMSAASVRAHPTGCPVDRPFLSSVSITERGRTSYAANSGRVPILLQQMARAQHRPTSIAGAQNVASRIADPPWARPATKAPEGPRPTSDPHLQRPGDAESRQRAPAGVAMSHSAMGAYIAKQPIASLRSSHIPPLLLARTSHCNPRSLADAPVASQHRIASASHSIMHRPQHPTAQSQSLAAHRPRPHRWSGRCRDGQGWPRRRTCSIVARTASHGIASRIGHR